MTEPPTFTTVTTLLDEEDAQSGTAPSELHILVVDDDEAILATVSEILDEEGYRVRTAINGRVALDMVASELPELVLLDMRMPVLDGWGFASALKSRGTPLPILVMTAAQNARDWATEIGAQGYISKPFDIDDLIQAVRQVHPTT